MWFEGSGAPLRLAPGDQFVSKWSGKTITVVRWLGEGANGSVYLALDPDGPSHCALKIGNDTYSLQSEMNALGAVGRGAPALLLADDGEVRGRTFPFYLMPFIPGVPLGKVAPNSFESRLARCGWTLLLQLKALHEAGWAFGDLKPDNILIGSDGEARLVDYGGATPFGQSVKQFTELYDRGFWRAGGRKADAGYDAFAFAVAVLEAAGQGAKLRAAASSPQRRAEALVKLADETPALAAYRVILRKMLRGEVADTGEACRAWREASEKSNRLHPSRIKEALPSLWFAGALISFAVALWRVVG